MQRKVLTPSEVPERLLAFQRRYKATARPFKWEFTRDDLAKLIKKLDATAQVSLPLAA